MFIVISLVFCTILVAADQFFKYLVVEYVKPVEYIDVIEGFLRFRYIENTGAVFGSFSTHTVLLTIFSVILLAFTVIYLIKNKNNSKLINFCLLLMVSGGIGNIIDRIRLQYVVDYIEPVFVNFAVFNFADCLITIGAFALIIYLIVDLIKDFKKKDDNNDEDKDKERPLKRKRFIRKAEVEGDKEAAVFNAVITGESAEDVLNEIELGVDSWNKNTSNKVETEKTEDITPKDDVKLDNQPEELKEETELPKDDNGVKQSGKKLSIGSLDDIDFKSLK